MKIIQPVNYEHLTPNQCSHRNEQKIVTAMDEKLYDTIFSFQNWMMMDLKATNAY